MSTANAIATATAAINSTIAVSNCVATLSARINSVHSASMSARALVSTMTTLKPKPIELTVADVDPEHPDRLTILVKNARGNGLLEMAKWLNEEAAGYPRPPIWSDSDLNTVLMPWLVVEPDGTYIHFDRATQEKLAIYFRMRWS